MTLHRVELSMLGVPFAVVTDDERMARLVELFWEPFVVQAASPGAVEVSIRLAGDRWQLRSEGDPGGDARDPWVLAAVLRNLLTVRAAKLAPGIVPLHASVAERDGFHLVLSGPSEAGKTTLMLELLAQGWRYVSDDMAPVDGGRAHPLLKPLSVRDPARWAETTERWEVPAWLPPPERTALVPPGVFRSGPDEPYVPGAVLFSGYVAGAAPSLERLSPGEAVALAAQNLQFKSAPSPEDVAALARWTSAAPAYRIRYGDTGDALELVNRALAGP